MIKNWILLGDEAFEGSGSTWGRIELSKEQQSNWQDIVMEQLNRAIEKSAKVREMIDNSNIIEFDFYFFEKSKVAEEEVAEFMKLRKAIRAAEEDAPKIEEKNCIDENGNSMPKMDGVTVSLRDLTGGWIEYDYRDVKGKVEKDGQYKIILKGKEYDLEGIKHLNDDYDDYTSRELTTILKSSFLYFVEVNQNTIIAMPDENYIKEYIERERKYFDDAIKKGIISEEILIDRRAYRILDFCLNVLDIIESKEAKKTIEQWDRKQYENGERVLHEIKNSDSKEWSEEEIEQLNKLLDDCCIGMK